jgi:hypothetical protein
VGNGHRQNEAIHSGILYLIISYHLNLSRGTAHKYFIFALLIIRILTHRDQIQICSTDVGISAISGIGVNSIYDFEGGE